MFLNNGYHLIQLIDVGLDVRDPARLVALPARDPHPLRLQHSLLDLVWEHGHPVRDTVDPTESLTRHARPRAPQPISQRYSGTPASEIVAGMGSIVA